MTMVEMPGTEFEMKADLVLFDPDRFADTATVLAAINAGRKIVVTGVGKNLPVGEKIAATLT